MAKVDIHSGSIEVDAVTIAIGLGLDPSLIPALMKAGEITSACERGEEADAGRYRLTFFHGDQRFRITVDAVGAILATEHC
jgi:hypothetical protein